MEAFYTFGWPSHKIKLNEHHQSKCRVVTAFSIKPSVCNININTENEIFSDEGYKWDYICNLIFILYHGDLTLFKLVVFSIIVVFLEWQLWSGKQYGKKG